MRNLKKIFAALSGFLAIGALAACNNKTTYNVEGAAKKVMVTQDKSEAVTGSFEVARVVKFEDATYTVTWESNNSVVSVKEIAGNTEKYLIYVDYANNREKVQEVTLTAKVTIEGGDIVNKVFTFKVPKFTLNTIEEADAAKKNDSLTLKGVIVAKEAFNSTDKITNVYLKAVDGNGGFEAYKLKCTQEQYDSELVVGNTIYVSGPKSYYNDLRELSGCSYIFDDQTATQTVEAEDLTSTIAAGTFKTDMSKQCHLAEFKNVQIVSIDTPDANGQYSIYVGDPDDASKQATVRISKYFFTGKNATDYAFKNLNLVPGQTISVKGLVGWYNGGQLTPLTADAITAGAVDYAAAVANSIQAKAKTTLGAKVLPLKTIELPSRPLDAGLSGENYDGYTIEWTTTSTDVTLSTKDVAAKEAVAATDTTPAKPAEAAYKLTTLTTKKPEADTDVTLSLVVKNAEGGVVATRTVKFQLLKEVVYSTYANYLSAANDAELNVKGVIIAIKDKDNKTFFLQDAEGGVYYVYSSKAITADWFVVGKEIGVTGKKTVYQGMNELGSAAFIEVINDTVVTPTPADYTAKFTADGFTALEAKDQAKLVKFTGTVKSVASGTFTITVGDKEIAVYAGDSKNLPTAVANDTVEVTGLLWVRETTSDGQTVTQYQVKIFKQADIKVVLTDEQIATRQMTALKGKFGTDKLVKATEYDLAPSYEGATVTVTPQANATTLAYSTETKKLTVTPTAAEVSETVTIKVVAGSVEKTETITIVSQISLTNIPTETDFTKISADCVFGTDKAANAEGLGLDSTIFEASAVKNDAGTIATVNANNDDLRLYGKKSSSNGGEITISVKSGWKIESIKITFSTKTESTVVTVKAGDSAVTAADGVYVINGSSVTIQNTNVNDASAYKKVFIAKIEIVYSAVSA